MDTILDWYEHAKARLYSFIGNLLGLRQTILELRDRAARLVEAADRAGNPIIATAARRLASEIADDYRQQQAVEQKVQDAQHKIRSVDAEQSESGVGVLPIAMLVAAGAVVVSAVAAVVVHTQRVNLHARALSALEQKLLSREDVDAALGQGEGRGDLLGLGEAFGGLAKLAVIGGLLYFGVKYFGGRRRRAA